MRAPWPAAAESSAKIPVLDRLYLVFGLANRSIVYNDIAAGVVTGLISSLATYALIQYFFLQKKTHGVREWLPVSATYVWIVPTYLEYGSRFPHTKYYVVPPFDAQAATLINQLLRLAEIHYPRRKTIGSNRFSMDLISDNIATFCLPEKNIYSRIFLGLYNEIYINNQNPTAAVKDANIEAYINDVNFNRDYFGLKWFPIRSLDVEVREWRIRHFGRHTEAPGALFQSSININPNKNVHEPGVINYDYALVIKGPNPFNPASMILIICGIHGIGTLGGSLYLYQNAQDLFRLYPARAQAHLIEVQYTTKKGGDNYLDSEILKINHFHYYPLPSDRL